MDVEKLVDIGDQPKKERFYKPIATQLHFLLVFIVTQSV